MSGFIVTVHASTAASRKLELSGAAFARKGLVPCLAIDRPSYQLRLYANPSHDPSKAIAMDATGRFCTYVGTLIHEGKTGRDAAEGILQGYLSSGIQCMAKAIGNYCILIDDGSGLVIAGDPAGLHHFYACVGEGVVTNSFVAAALAQDSHRFRAQEILEYILLGATFGENTLLEGIELVGSDQWLHVRDGKIETAVRDNGWRAADPTSRTTNAEALVELALEAADSYYSQIATAFAGRVTAALSGGYDSRLNLALLLRQGVSPSLFVYGAPQDADVRIAKEICNAEGLALSHQDRGNRPDMEPVAYWQNQESVFHGLDGLTQYGFVCEPFEVSHRQSRVAGGLVAVNGGGGEIWRDFWKLPDRAMSTREFTFAYFQGRFSGLRATVSEGQFLGALAQKIERIVDASGRYLTSPEVQSLYPRVRLRYWQGKNNSVDNHIGYAVTPFAEATFTRPSIQIPMHSKRDGWFERQMLLRVSPSLAAYRSSHGYALKNGPPLLERGKSFVTRNLPAAIRTRRRRMSLRRNRYYFQADHYVRERFGAAPFEVERHVDLSELGDPLSFSRALTVERMLRGDWQGGG